MEAPGAADTAGTLAWPPLAEDLRRLYVEQKLSAMKIARVYGLKYASEKTAESTILHHLKKNGIARRDPAEHVRKSTGAVVDDWVRRYEQGESLREIAGDLVAPGTVFHQLRSRGLQLRDKVEAQIKAVTKFEKKPFSGERHELAYLIGYTIGDLATTRHGRAVRVRLGTTHPAMRQLFRSLFEAHGPIYEYPKKAILTEFEWSLDCDLDMTFAFFLDIRASASRVIADEELFFDFLAGFFDAEGCIFYHKKNERGAFELSITNTNFGLLQEISVMLRKAGIAHALRKDRIDRETLIRKGIKNPSEFAWRLQIWRYKEVSWLLRILKLRHPEKIEKAAIALRLPFRPPAAARREILAVWDSLIARIDQETANCIREAKVAWEHKSASIPRAQEESDSIRLE
jgi:hypothetical protein